MMKSIASFSSEELWQRLRWSGIFTVVFSLILASGFVLAILDYRGPRSAIWPELWSTLMLLGSLAFVWAGYHIRLRLEVNIRHRPFMHFMNNLGFWFTKPRKPTPKA